MNHLISEDSQWNARIANFPGAHLLQTSQWAAVKSSGGWKPYYAIWPGESGKETQAAALILERTLHLGGFAAPIRILYVPRGPLLDWSCSTLREQVLSDLAEFARNRHAVYCKIDPELPVGYGVPGDPVTEMRDPVGESALDWMRKTGWIFSSDQIQFRNTVLINLEPDEEILLAKMKQKTRYNIRLAGKKGVSIRVGEEKDFPMLYHMYAETSLRDGFVIRGLDYYLHVWDIFSKAGMLEPLIAEVEGEAVAAVVIFRFAGKAWYLYGMSRDLHREKMPTYLLQWEAMRRAKAAGCTQYDLWGAPDEFSEKDSMWGVYRFKEGLGGEVLRTAGAWDYAPSPLSYKVYTQVMPRVLAVMRRRGVARTQQEVRLL